MKSVSPFRFFAFPLFACFGQYLWMANFSPTDLWASMAWIPLLTFAWFCIGGLSHEIVHGNLKLPGTFGIAIARSIGTVIGIPHSVYREVHMRHHAYLNTPLDWEMWPYGDPNVSLRRRRIFVWLDVVFAIVVTPIVWGRICFSSQSPVDAETRRVMRREYWAVAVFWCSFLATCVWVHRSGLFLFLPEHLIFAVPAVLATMCNGFRKLMDHVGTCSFDPMLGTRTIVGASLMTKVLSYLNFDLAVHGPHHRYPKLDHTQLKTRMMECAAENPDQAYPVYSSFFAAVAHTIRSVAVNPGVGVNAGCTDSLSHLPLEKSVSIQ